MLSILCATFFLNTAFAQSSGNSAVVKTELLFTNAPFAECHASTIAETRDGLVAAFFGGTKEKNPDVGIWVTRFAQRTWIRPLEVANGIQQNGTRYPCWNPVLFQIPDDELLLFYKVGPSPAKWWGMVMRSTDGGTSWSAPLRLADGILGPIKNKPVLLSAGTLLSASSRENDGWNVHMESSTDKGSTWKKTAPLTSEDTIEAIQPTILSYKDRSLQLLCRSKQDCIVESWSHDAGSTWAPLTRTSLPNPNSGIDAVTLRDGRQLLVYNHSRRVEGAWGGPRSPLNVAISRDGKTWFAVAILEQEPGEFSYPAVIQTKDDLVHITYTWKRVSIKHVVMDPAKFVPSEIRNGQWPSH